MNKCLRTGARAAVFVACALLVSSSAFAEETAGATEPTEAAEAVETAADEAAASDETAADEAVADADAEGADEAEAEEEVAAAEAPVAEEPAGEAPVSEPAVAESAAEVEPVVVESPTETGVEADAMAGAALDDELDAILGDDAGPSKPWSVSGGIRTVIGQGTFASVGADPKWEGVVEDPSNAFNRAALNFSLGGSYQVGDFNFSLGMGFMQWLTAGGGSNGPQEWRLQDMSLGAGWKGHTFEASKISIVPSLSFTLPTSSASRVSTLLFDASANVSISRTFFDRVTLSGSLGASNYFHQYTSPMVSIDKIGFENALYRAGGAEVIGGDAPTHIAIEGYNTQYSVGGSLSARVKIWSTLSGTITYGLSNHWTYDIDNDDEFSADVACVGRCSGQSARGAISLSYGINDWLSVSGGISTSQPPKTADNKSFRFPFWNFEGAAANRSSISFGVSASY